MTVQRLASIARTRLRCLPLLSLCSGLSFDRQRLLERSAATRVRHHLSLADRTFAETKVDMFIQSPVVRLQSL